MSLRAGIIGTGWGARIQVPAFRAAGLEISALWGRTAGKAAREADSLGIPYSTDDALALIARDDVDLVSIVTPPATHLPWSIAALEAGKHVLCEKPTAMNATEAEAMLAAAEARPGLVALIDHELRFVPSRQRMRALVQDGFVGEVFSVGWEVAVGSRLDPARRWNWWSDAGQGGGVLGAIGSHAVDMLSWTLGSRVTQVQAELRTFVAERPDDQGAPRPVTSDDFAQVQLRFANGASGVLYMSVVQAGPNRSRTWVSGSEGTLVTGDGWDADPPGALASGGRLMGARYGQRTTEDLSVPDGVELPEGLPSGEFQRGSVLIGRALHKALVDGERRALAPAATFADGLYVQRVLDAARESASAGHWVDV